MPGRKFKSAAQLRERCDAYFKACDEAGKLYGEAGLALFLDVSRDSLRSWYDGAKCPDLRAEVQRAYLKIQDQIETSPAYMEKGGMATRAIFFLKQPRYGGFQDRVESKSQMTVQVHMGDNMEESDLK